MALDGYSLESVRKWAKQNFAADFERLPHAHNFKLRLYMVPGYEDTDYIKGLIFGTTLNKAQKPVDVLAWLEGSQMKVGYIGKTRTGKTEIRCKSLIKDTIRFSWPYYCILEGKSDAAIARFEALVRYCFLVKGGTNSEYVRDGFDNFVAHFPGACHDLAAGSSLGDLEYSKVTKGKSKTETAENTGTYGPLMDPNAPYAFEAFANNVDNGGTTVTVFSSPSPSPPPADFRHDLRHDLTNEAEAERETGAKEMDRLRRKVFDLNIRLMIAEGMARTAKEDAERWKARYEELMKKIEGVCGQQM